MLYKQHHRKFKVSNELLKTLDNAVPKLNSEKIRWWETTSIKSGVGALFNGNEEIGARIVNMKFWMKSCQVEICLENQIFLFINWEK